MKTLSEIDVQRLKHGGDKPLTLTDGTCVVRVATGLPMPYKCPKCPFSGYICGAVCGEGVRFETTQARE